MLHCAAITGILFCRELSNLVRMFVLVRSWSSSNMGHLGSVCLLFLCAAITGILFYRELSNFIRIVLWTRSWSTPNIAHLGSVCLFVRLSTLSLCCDNRNTFLQRTFKLCIWVLYHIRRTPIVFGVITSKVKVTGNFFGFFFLSFFWLHFFIPFSNATLNQIHVLTHFRLGIWIICQIWGTPIVFGVILSKVKVIGIFMDNSVARILTT